MNTNTKSRQHGSIAVPGQPVNLPGLRQIPESLVLHTPAAPVKTAHLNSVKAGPQAGEVLRCRDVLAMQIQDGCPVGMGLLGYHHVHRNCAVRRFGVNPVAETRKLRTGYHSLTGNCQRSCSSAYWSRLVKRRRALLESNPPRNSQLETHRGR